MASISRAQAEALAEGFLDNIGTDDKGELQPRETFTELFLLVGEFVEAMQDNLVSSNNVASGELSKSIVARNPQENGSVVSVDIIMNFYGEFINKGVKGTKSGSSKAGYSFKDDNPSRKMVKAISKWMKRASTSTRSVKKYKGAGAHERKNKSISQFDGAYAMARSIKQKGIKGNGFVDKAAAETDRKMQDRLVKAFEIDLYNSI